MSYLIFKKKFSQNIFNYRHEKVFELPYSVRTYIDGNSAEAQRHDIEEKICHLGGALIRGVDLYTKFKNDIEDHIDVYLGYETTVKRSIIDYINFLRNGYRFPRELILESVQLRFLLDILEEEILLRYEESNSLNSNELDISFKDLPIDESYKSYLFTSEETIKKACNSTEDIYKIQESTILKMNRWKELADEFDHKHLYFDKELIYPGDEPYIDAYKEKQADYIIKKEKEKEKAKTVEKLEKIQEKIEDAKNRDLILQVPPEPWSGNILNAKLVLLSLNPGYIEYLNKTLANMFKDKYAAEITEDKLHILNMDGKQIDTSDATRVLAQNYWRSILTKFGEKVYGVEYEDADHTIKKENPIFSNVAICQWFAYTTAASPDIKDVWPSQKFTKWVILYLTVSRPNVKFMVMRSAKLWETLLGPGLWNYLLHTGRLYISEHYRSQHLTENNIGDKQYRDIKKHLTGKN